MRLRELAALWGVIGVIVFLCFPVYRLSGYAWVALNEPLSIWQWLVLVPFAVFMAYSEGYRGFQKSFSPRVVSRALYLRKQAGWINGVLAPVFCIGYFGTPRKRQMIIFSISLMVLMLVFIVSHMPQPWRGIVDIGVVIGLCWGLMSLVVFAFKAFTSGDFLHPVELSPRYQKETEETPQG